MCNVLFRICIQTDKTVSYMKNLVGMTPRSTMTTISDHHMYVIGQRKVTLITAEQFAALAFHGDVEMFLD